MIMDDLEELKEKMDKDIEDVLYDSGWKKLKMGGSNHYKSGTVEPIDLYKAGNMFHDFACASIMKYAFRSRKEMNLNKELFNKNMDKIIHYASLLKAMREEAK